MKLKHHEDLGVKIDLVKAYHLLAHAQLDDLTYTHLSARPKGANYYYIYSFGLLFNQVHVDNLIKVKLDGKNFKQDLGETNPTGHVIHANIYQARPDINAIFHLHTEAGVAVSSLECGLLPVSQWALHFYEEVAYHPYQSLVLDFQIQGQKLIKDLGQKFVMFLQNHGTLCAGTTIPEALFFTHHLEKACRSQLKMMACQVPLVQPSHATCLESKKALLNFEKNLGQRDWEALKRT